MTYKNLIIITSQAPQGSGYFGVFVGAQNVSHTNEACRLVPGTLTVNKLEMLINVSLPLLIYPVFLGTNANLCHQNLTIVSYWHFNKTFTIMDIHSFTILYFSPQWSDNNSTHATLFSIRKILLSVLKEVIDSPLYCKKRLPSVEKQHSNKIEYMEHQKMHVFSRSKLHCWKTISILFVPQDTSVIGQTLPLIVNDTDHPVAF